MLLGLWLLLSVGLAQPCAEDTPASWLGDLLHDHGGDLQIYWVSEATMTAEVSDTLKEFFSTEPIPYQLKENDESRYYKALRAQYALRDFQPAELRAVMRREIRELTRQRAKGRTGFQPPTLHIFHDPVQRTFQLQLSLPEQPPPSKHFKPPPAQPDLWAQHPYDQHTRVEEALWLALDSIFPELSEPPEAAFYAAQRNDVGEVSAFADSDLFSGFADGDLATLVAAPGEIIRLDASGSRPARGKLPYQELRFRWEISDASSHTMQTIRDADTISFTFPAHPDRTPKLGYTVSLCVSDGHRSKRIDMIVVTSQPAMLAEAIPTIRTLNLKGKSLSQRRAAHAAFADELKQLPPAIEVLNNTTGRRQRKLKAPIISAADCLDSAVGAQLDNCLRFELEDTPLPSTRYEWTKVSGPALDGLVITSYGERVETRPDGEVVITSEPSLSIRSMFPGLYAFEVVRIDGTTRSPPLRVSRHALYTRSTVGYPWLATWGGGYQLLNDSSQFFFSFSVNAFPGLSFHARPTVLMDLFNSRENDLEGVGIGAGVTVEFNELTSTGQQRSLRRRLEGKPSLAYYRLNYSKVARPGTNNLFAELTYGQYCLLLAGDDPRYCEGTDTRIGVRHYPGAWSGFDPGSALSLAVVLGARQPNLAVTDTRRLYLGYEVRFVWSRRGGPLIGYTPHPDTAEAILEWTQSTVSAGQ